MARPCSPLSRKKRPRIVAILLLSSFLCAFAAIGQRSTPTLGIDDIQAGMTGYGLTVFEGTTPERFDIEVVGTLHGFRPDQDLILIRTPHPRLNTTRAVGGMSGSPIYINDRLIGAYAYGWQFGLEPIAGVTPIRDMLRLMDLPTRPLPFPGATARSVLRSGARLERANVDSADSRHSGPDSGRSVHAFSGLRAFAESAHGGNSRAALDSPRMTRVDTPIMFAGFDDDVVRALQGELAPLGFGALQGGGSGSGSSGNTTSGFVDGGAIGVQLVSGDVSATAVGTVTHVDGSRLVAFGHPMLGAGEVRLPTATARIVHILASAARSFKISEPIAQFGTLVHDRQAAIVVDTDEVAATIPVRIRLRGVDSSARQEWNMRVASHEALTPTLVFATLANAIKTASPEQTDVMFTASYRATIHGHDPIELVDRGYMGAGPGDLAALSRLRLFQLLHIAYNNAFRPSRLEALELTLDIRFADEVLDIIEASAPSQLVDPGARVPVQVRLRRYGQADQIRTIQVEIPERAAGNRVKVRIVGGQSVSRPRAQARNMEDLIDAVSESFDGRSAVAIVELPSRGLRFPGHVAQDLPRGVLNSLQFTSGQNHGRPFVTQVYQETDFGELVTGNAELEFVVRDTPREH